MREVFKSKAGPDPGEVFYTITAEDVGLVVVSTEIGAVNLAPCIGRVTRADVGRRVYRKRVQDPDEPLRYLWQAESDYQRARRLAVSAEVRERYRQVTDAVELADGSTVMIYSDGSWLRRMPSGKLVSGVLRTQNGGE